MEYYQFIILIAQCLIVAIFLLLFFRLRTIFGLGLFYIAIGLFKFMHYFFTQAFSLELASGIHILIGPTIITPAILFSLLLIYIREDAGEVRKIIYALIFFNFFFAAMMRISALGINGVGFVNRLNLPEHFFRIDIGSIIAGSLVLFIDGIVLIVLYEFLSKKISSLFLRIFLTMTSILFLHALIFNSAAFIFKPVDTSLLRGYALSILISKAIPISVYTVSFWLYLVYFEKRSAISMQTGSSFRDVFNLLTYRQKYEQVFKEKETQKLALQKSEILNKTLIEHLPQRIFIKDLNSVYLSCNRNYATDLGTTPNKIIGKNDFDYFPSELAKAYRTDDQKVIRQGETKKIEEKYLLKGVERWIHTIKVPYRDSEDNIIGILGVFEDITERKHAEIELKASEERYRLMLNTTLDGFILADEEGKIMQVNPSYCKMIGYSEQELLSMNIHEIEVMESEQQTKEHIQQLILAGKARFETQHRAKDGHLIDLEVSVSNLKVDEKTLGAAFVRDITERKLADDKIKAANQQLQANYQQLQATEQQLRAANQELITSEKALKESEEKFQKIINESFSGISVTNEEGKIIVWNNALEKITGINKTETIDQYIWDVQADLLDRDTSDTKRKEELKSSLLSVLKTGQSPWLNTIMERDYIHPDGSVKRVSGRMYTIQTQKGYLVVSVSQDVTERNLAEKALKEAQSNLQALLDNRKDSIWSLDRNYNFLVYNKPYADVIYSNMGVRLKKGMNALEIHPKEVNDFWKPKFDEVFDGNYVTFEFSHILEGKEHFFEVFMNPIYTDNKISGLSALSMDITDRKQAEQALSASEEKYRDVVENTEDLITIVDGKGNLIYANPVCRKIWGKSEEEVIGKSAFEMIHPDDRELTRQEFKNWITAKLDIITYENRQVNQATGEIFTLQWIIKTQYNDDGSVEKITSLARDITEQKLAQKNLNESEKHAREIFDYSSVPIWEEDFSELKLVFDKLKKSGVSNFERYFMENPKEVKRLASLVKILDINQTSLEFYDVKSKEELIIGLSNWFNDTSWEVFEKELVSLANGETKFESEIEVVTPKGVLKYLQLKLTVPPGFENTLKRVLVSFFDITDIKNSQKALKESEEKFRNIFQQSPLAIQLYDPEGNLLNINPKTLELFGIDNKKYVSGFNFWNDPNLSAKDAKALKKAKSVYISTTYNFEDFGNSVHFPTSRKGLIYVDMYVMPMKSENKIIGYLVHIVEVTDQKQTEKELIKHRDHLEELVNERTNELESSNKELEAFAYSVSHDLRAPLRAINGFTRILMEDYVEKLDNEGKRLGSVIQKNAQKMGTLIDDLLAFSRLGRTAMHFSSIDMNNMVNATYYEVTNASERKRIEFSVAGLPDAYGDTNMMRQVWMNLISNAIKFSSKKGKAFISITGIQDDDKINYRITDNGVGFNMQYVNKIFDVFQRLHGDKEYPGTGVGLSIVQRIINRHNGKIWAESEVDKGATFYFSLPKKGINEPE